MSATAYLDHAATTPMFEAALAEMLVYLGPRYANSSGSHRASRQVRAALDEARDTVAELLGVSSGEIVFTSGGTEADNTAIRGVLARRGGIAVCPSVEHHAVLHPVEHLGGLAVAVDTAGAVDLEALGGILEGAGESVGLVSVMAVNNEVGTITDLAAVARVVRAAAPQAVLHTDAVQAPSWIDLRSVTPHVDLMSLSAHKFGGPKGVGVLWVRSGVDFEPLLLGGGQERDRRSGTHDVAGIVAAATALSITDTTRVSTVERIGRQRDRLVDGLCRDLDGVVETVARDRKVAGSAHICIEGVESESLLFLLDRAEVCASAASACASGAMEPSHVLAAMGIDPTLRRGAVRLSLGHTTTDAEVDHALDVLVESVRTLRR